jgi:pimeloyl-ACP methyl ester carboxylesterase
MQPQSKYVKANGINHHYLGWGNPESPPLLLLHATGLCAHAWKPVARELAHNFHVMAFDQRGPGDSDPSDRGYTFHLVGEDLAAVIQAMNLSRFYIVGHSSGGLSALIADSLLPGRIYQAVLVEAPVGARPASAPSRELQDRAQRTRMKRSVWESRQVMYDAYCSRPAFKDWQRRLSVLLSRAAPDS